MPKTDFEYDDDLVEALKAKDRNAYNYLYDNYSAALFGVISRVLGNQTEIAEDILQDVFVKIWHNIETYNSQKGRLYTWMLNIARNAAIDTIRSATFKQSKVNTTIDHINNQNTIHKLSDNIPVEDFGIKQISNLLEDKYRILIDLCYFKGYTQEEVAQKLDIPVGTVKTRLRKALLNLKEILK
ncbi:MAG TPA: sigma-70 family RNA polymerase sigma factor [Edaphocola sp.]|nr:sigma-70 family RNA polymerase sigma factor [Edaphocola sp.]